jgi:hypothetical protein
MSLQLVEEYAPAGRTNISKFGNIRNSIGVCTNLQALDALPERWVTVHSGDMGNTSGVTLLHFAGAQSALAGVFQDG